MKGRFGKTLKGQNYYENDYVPNFILFLMSLLTAPIVKNSHIYNEFCLIFEKNRTETNLKVI